MSQWSQRSGGNFTFSSQNNRSQSVKNPLTEFFKGIIRESGITLSPNDDPNTLTAEQALVVRNIDKLLGENYSDDCIEKFLQGFKLLINKEKYLKKALLPTNFKKTRNEPCSDMKIEQESLFRIFLKTNHLQSEILEILLDKITNCVTEEMEDTSWLRLFLAQLRYLPHIKNTEVLTTKLLDIMEIAPFPCQLEILDSIPEILPDSEYSETAKQLVKMLDKNDELSGAIIDCLNALNLDSEIRVQVQDHILSKILMGPSIKIFPVLLEFLMSDHKAPNLSTTFIKIRNALDTIMSSSDKKSKEKASGKIVIFNRFQSLATTPKIMSETWLNVISSIKVHTDHKPVDLLILFMLHTCATMKKRLIETTFRRRVKDGLFKCSLLEQVFAKYLPQQLLRDYFKSMTEIGTSLLRSSNDVAVTEFASTLFKLLFNHEFTETIYRQEMLDSLILLVGASDQKNVQTILNIIDNLLEEDTTKMQHHSVHLMRLLEKLDTFELKNVKLVFEILCSLICSDDSMSGLKEEIHMIIRKQLSSSKHSIKHRGIISAVVMAKNVAIVEEEQSDSSGTEDSTMSISDLSGYAKEAAAILEMVNTSTSGYPELLGLYYDQLAFMLTKTEDLDKNFLAWLYESIVRDFDETFVTETTCLNIGELEFNEQFNLNSKKETESPISINIAGLMLKSELQSILILAPHFRLLRLVHYRQQNGNLSTIAALLGCGVILPKTDCLENLDSEQLKLTSDCLFHCINWFREVINGFVTQKDKKLLHKVVQRISNVMEAEKMLNQCLAKVPDHKLPVSYFDSSSKSYKQCVSPQKETNKPKRPKKKAKTAETIDDTIAPTAGTSAVTTITTNNSKKVTREEYTIHFREMDTDLVTLIKYPLNTEEASTSTNEIRLNMSQLNFILKDFVAKLAMLTKGSDLGLSHLNVVPPLKFITDCVNIFPNISIHFTSIIKKIDEALQKADNHLGAPELYSEEALEIKIGFGLILESLSLVFNWPGFQHSKHLDLLRNILKALQPQDAPILNSVNRLIVELIDRLEEYVDRCLVLSHAVNLIQIMEALYSITPSSMIRSKIAKTSGKLLNKRWYNQSGKLDTGKICSSNIDILIKSYLSSASVKTICGQVGTLQEQAPELKTKHDNLEMLASVDKSNVYIFFRNLWNRLHDRIKIEIQSLTNNEHLTLWRTVALTMQGLMMVVKAQETKSNLACFLKKSIAILKIFLSHGIPILEIRLKSKPNQVVEIFQAMQSTTRFLHYLCCHSKVTKDACLMAYVPQLRLTLETLIYRVKAALVANNCSEAFWMGNLKNRDLRGGDILSQSSENTREGSDEDEEEMVEDDESRGSIDDNDDDEDESRHKSESEIFE